MVQYEKVYTNFSQFCGFLNITLEYSYSFVLLILLLRLQIWVVPQIIYIIYNFFMVQKLS